MTKPTRSPLQTLPLVVAASIIPLIAQIGVYERFLRWLDSFYISTLRSVRPISQTMPLRIQNGINRAGTRAERAESR